MFCPACQSPARKFGKDRSGAQRYRCNSCQKTFADRPAKLLNRMNLKIERAAACLKMLLEGCSVRTTERLTGVHRDTILKLLRIGGTRARRLLWKTQQDLPVRNVEADEIWSFVSCKEKHRLRHDPEAAGRGDSWCFIGFDADTKMILTYHLGKRTPHDAYCFAMKLRVATQPGFQLTTDGFKGYNTAIPRAFGSTVDYAQLIKRYGHLEDDHRYSPPVVISIHKELLIGEPDETRVCTSYVERSNLNIRMQVRRLTRLTNGFSKSWRNHEAALALYFAWHNFCRRHGTLKQTPAMEAKLTDHVWTVEELLEAGQD